MLTPIHCGNTPPPPLSIFDEIHTQRQHSRHIENTASSVVGDEGRVVLEVRHNALDRPDSGCNADEEAKQVNALQPEPLRREALDLLLHFVHLDREVDCQLQTHTHMYSNEPRRCTICLSLVSTLPSFWYPLAQREWKSGRREMGKNMQSREPRGSRAACLRAFWVA